MKNKFRNNLVKPLLVLLLATMVISCSKPLQEITYMYGLEPGKVYVANPTPEIYKIRTNDHLYINVIGDDPLAVQFLNLMPGNSSANTTSSNMDLVTYIVDEVGNIWYPQFGTIAVAGKTVGEIRDELQKKVDMYIQNASVFVKLVQRSVTVLGEVKNPGQHEMLKNQLSIFEAIGTAGDITDFGNRQSVKLVRETEKGRLLAEIDLTDKKLINSPYYYILPNDVIYVEPTDKVYGKKTFPVGTAISLIFSTISTALLIYTVTK